MCRGSLSLLSFTGIVILHAEIAQLVEHNLAKVGVAGSESRFPLDYFFIINQDRFKFRGPSGGIGRRARFRCVCFATCSIKSCLGHNVEISLVLERWRNW